MDEKDQPLLERLVVAVEGLLKINQDMADTDKEQRTDPGSGPPLCAHCNKFNPNIDLSEEFGGQGPFGEFGMMVRCLSCGNNFYAAPDGWTVFKTKDELLELLQHRSQLIKTINL